MNRDKEQIFHSKIIDCKENIKRLTCERYGMTEVEKIILDVELEYYKGLLALTKGTLYNLMLVENTKRNNKEYILTKDIARLDKDIGKIKSLINFIQNHIKEETPINLYMIVRACFPEEISESYVKT